MSAGKAKWTMGWRTYQFELFCQRKGQSIFAVKEGLQFLGDLRVFDFLRITGGAHAVELMSAILVRDEAVGAGANGADVFTIADGKIFGRLVRVFQLRGKRAAVKEVGFGELCEVTKGREEVEGLHDRTGAFSTPVHAGCRDDERRPK